MSLIAIKENEFEVLKQDIIQEIKNTLAQKSSAFDELITEEALLKKLGRDKSTVWRYEKKGILKPIRIGHTKMYRLSDIISLQSSR